MESNKKLTPQSEMKYPALSEEAKNRVVKEVAKLQREGLLYPKSKPAETEP